MAIKSPHHDLFASTSGVNSRDGCDTVGPHFDATHLAHARERSANAVQEILAALTPGMTQREATRHARGVLKALGAERAWHPPIMRFGPNTVQAFRDPTDPDQVLGEDDFAYVDIGPVWRGHEGDAGATRVFGERAGLQRLAHSAQAIWNQLRDEWARDGLSGSALYARASVLAQTVGYELHPSVRGHRIGDWPHGAYVRGPLATLGRRPSPGLWVLEIHLLCPRLRRGAFVEQSLV